MEAPGTAPGSATLIPQGVYRHSRQAGAYEYSLIAGSRKARGDGEFSDRGAHGGGLNHPHPHLRHNLSLRLPRRNRQGQAFDLAAKHDITAVIKADNVEDVLAGVYANGG